MIDGEDYLVGLLHHEGRTKGQGVFISERPGIVTDEYVSDVPRRARYYLSWEEALEAAGLGRAAADDREINASPAASA